jgi:triosephosphate isomerase
MSKKIVIANWKMNPNTLKEAENLLGGVVKKVSGFKKTEVVVCAPFIYLERLKKLSKKIFIGAQDSFMGDVGPFTGEISGEMLYDFGVRYVILGHSERRALGENNELINKKIKSALGSGLTPIVCVGEKERDEAHGYFEVVKNQITECMKSITKDSISQIVVAYEPIWSISTTANRRDATSSDAREMAVFIRKVLSDLSSPEVAHKTRIIYGGSVNDRDTEDFLKNGGVDGLLVGKASLDAEKFSRIIKICETLSK